MVTQQVQSDDVVTVMEAAKVLKVHFTTVYRQITAGKVSSFKFGGIVFIPMREVERLKVAREANKEP